MANQTNSISLTKAQVDSLNDKARIFFKNYPEETVMYATADGNVFLARQKAMAEDHAKKKKQLDIITITRGSTLPDPPPTPAETAQAGYKAVEEAHSGGNKAALKAALTALTPASVALLTNDQQGLLKLINDELNEPAKQPIPPTPPAQS